MPTITIVNSGKKLPISPAISILNTLLRNGEPIQHVCGGKAQCGTCRIEIIEGQRSLSPKTEREIVRLAAINAAANERLACQTYAFNDISVKFP